MADLSEEEQEILDLEKTLKRESNHSKEGLKETKNYA